MKSATRFLNHWNVLGQGPFEVMQTIDEFKEEIEKISVLVRGEERKDQTILVIFDDGTAFGLQMRGEIKIMVTKTKKVTALLHANTLFEYLGGRVLEIKKGEIDSFLQRWDIFKDNQPCEASS